MLTCRAATTRRAGVPVLLLVLLSGSAPWAPASAQEAQGKIHGEIMQPDGETALQGARVYAINVKTAKQYVSEATDSSGRYAMRGLPAGTYDVAIEAAGQIYVVDNLVDLSRGESRNLSCAIQPMRPANRVISGLPHPKGSATAMEAFEGGPVEARSFWNTPGGYTLLAVLSVGAGLAIANALDDDDGSPSSP
jgi:hypothetical protein